MRTDEEDTQPDTENADLANGCTADLTESRMRVMMALVYYLQGRTELYGLRVCSNWSQGVVESRSCRERLIDANEVTAFILLRAESSQMAR